MSMVPYQWGCTCTAAVKARPSISSLYVLFSPFPTSSMWRNGARLALTQREWGQGGNIGTGGYGGETEAMILLERTLKNKHVS
jgi:hypothetical protein